MKDGFWLVTILLAALAGAVGGAWATSRLMRRRFDTRLRLTAERLQQRHALATDQLRAAQVRAQTELELARGIFSRQLAAMKPGTKATSTGLDPGLQTTAERSDRAHIGSTEGQPDEPDTADGFAATQTMYEHR